MTRLPVTTVIEGREVPLGFAIVGESSLWVTLLAAPLHVTNSSLRVEGVCGIELLDRMRAERDEARAKLAAAQAELAAARASRDELLSYMPED